MSASNQDILNYIELLTYFNKQSLNCKYLNDHFMLLYGNKFKNCTSSVEEVCILVFLIDYISVVRCGNTRLLRNKKEIESIYDLITDVPIHFEIKNQSMEKTIAKLKKELKDNEKQITNNNKYTKCCHSHLNYNYRIWSKHKQSKGNIEIKKFNLHENTFDENSNNYIKTLCELLDKQTHILKIKNKIDRSWYCDIELDITLQFNNNVQFTKLMRQNIKSLKLFFALSIAEGKKIDESNNSNSNEEGTKAKNSESKTSLFNNNTKNEEEIIMKIPQIQSLPNIDLDKNKCEDLKSYLRNLSNVIVYGDDHNKLYYKITLNFNNVESTKLKVLFTYLKKLENWSNEIVSSGSLNNNNEICRRDVLELSKTLNIIFFEFNVTYSLKMAYFSNNNNNNNKIGIKNKLLEFILLILIKPVSLLNSSNPMENSSTWLHKIIINKSIDELMKIRNNLEIVIKCHSHIPEFGKSISELEILIGLIDTHGIDVLNLEYPMICNESINFIKMIHGEEKNNNNCHNIFISVEDNSFLNYITNNNNRSPSGLDESSLDSLPPTIVEMVNLNNNNYEINLNFYEEYNLNYIPKYLSNQSICLINGIRNDVIIHKKFISNNLIVGLLQQINKLKIPEIENDLKIQGHINLNSYEDFNNDQCFLNLRKNKMLKELEVSITNIESNFESCKILNDKIPFLSVKFTDGSINMNFIRKFIKYFAYGCPHTIFENNYDHFKEHNFLFGKLARNKTEYFYSLERLKLIKTLPLDSNYVSLRNTLDKRFNNKYLKIYYYDFGIYCQILKIDDTLALFQKNWLDFEEENIKKFLLESKARLESIKNILFEWFSLCLDLALLKKSVIIEVNDDNEGNDASIPNKKDWWEEEEYDLKMEHQNPQNDDVIETTNKELNNNVDGGMSITEKDILQVVNECKVSVTNDSFIDMEPGDKNNMNKKKIELYFVKLIHKNFLKEANNRDQVINYVYFYVLYHFSESGFLNNNVDKIGWTETLNILGLRLVDLIVQSIDTYLNSLLPFGIDGDKIGFRTNKFKMIAQYNKKINENQLKTEMKNYKMKNWAIIWATLNRISDSLCWYYISYSKNISSMSSHTDLVKFKEVIENELKINKNTPMFDRNLKEVYRKSQIFLSNKVKDNYFILLFNQRKDEINKRLLLNTAIKIVNLKFLDAGENSVRNKILDYTKKYNSFESMEKGISKVLGDLQVDKVEVHYYNQDSSLKKRKRKVVVTDNKNGTVVVLSKGYVIDKFVVPDDETEDISNTTNNKKTKKNLPQHDDDPAATSSTTSSEINLSLTKKKRKRSNNLPQPDIIKNDDDKDDASEDNKSSSLLLDQPIIVALPDTFLSSVEENIDDNKDLEEENKSNNLIHHIPIPLDTLLSSVEENADNNKDLEEENKSNNLPIAPPDILLSGGATKEEENDYEEENDGYIDEDIANIINKNVKNENDSKVILNEVKITYYKHLLIYKKLLSEKESKYSEIIKEKDLLINEKESKLNLLVKEKELIINEKDREILKLKEQVNEMLKKGGGKNKKK